MKVCIEDNCFVSASFNNKVETPLYCVKHKKQNMINVKSKICLQENCIKQCSFNFPNQKALYCCDHKKENMING